MCLACDTLEFEGLQQELSNTDENTSELRIGASPPELEARSISATSGAPSAALE
jgi:hypothetical protein